MAKKTYYQKLQSPKWQKKRLEILNRDNFTCVKCGDTETQLHVHHKKYTKEPYDAPNKDLETLCKHCHKLHHLIKDDGMTVTHVFKTVSDDGYYIAFIFRIEESDCTVLLTIINDNIENKIFFKYNSDVVKKLVELNSNEFDKLSNTF